MSFRTGIGYDVHPLVAGRPLVLGGVAISSDVGFSGHSDGDVLSHAIADAILGAAGLGDLGEHFPSEGPAATSLAGARSVPFLKTITELIDSHGFTVVNVDATVVLEQPRIASHREQMRAVVADALGLDVQSVSIKATTTDRLGAIGRGEGGAALAVVLIRSDEDRG
jgi:2-C-methyl-D-erythritol 2,4-cyclodiphosphate synthase